MLKSLLRKTILFLFGILIITSANVFSEEASKVNSIDGIKATVVDVIGINEKEIRDNNNSLKEQEVSVLINSGKYKGEFIQVLNTIDTSSLNEASLLNKGDEILLSVEEKDGKIVNGYMYEYARDKYLIYLVVIFMVLMILIGGSKGIKSIFSLGLTIVIVLKIFPDLLLKGYNPLKIAVCVGVAIIIINLLVVNGNNRKTISAMIGTSIGVAISGILALVVGDLSRLTGLNMEEGQMISYISESVKFDYKGLLFASILIGTLGAVMNVNMSIASAMNEINESNSQMDAVSMIKSGMSIGKDMIGSMSSTLILAYVGVSLQSLIVLISCKVSFIDVINQSIIATEILRSLSGIIGLIVSVPVTVVSFALIRNKNSCEKTEKLLGEFQRIN